MPPQTADRNTEVTAEVTRLTPGHPEKRPDGADPPGARDTEKDGGAAGWLVVLVSFLCNGIIFGIVNCYGVLYVALLQKMEANGVANAAFKCSLVGSLCTGLTFLMSAASGVLADQAGLRRTAFFGAILAFVGLLISAFVSNQIEALLVTYGLIFGTGASLVYTPSLVVLGHHFERRLGFVNGLVAMGSSVFTAVMPFIMKSLLASVAMKGTLLVLAGQAVACGVVNGAAGVQHSAV
ncbi:monocarboxylate transporter 10-like [Pollicipes pollicipes]|uniref:monocarboxylate transporter 10-like n=1 Tax=Pollicipes pollicipes TaxID=41117 RepID=UPI001885488E|nr:monocarboxylate transporter 10-like [Pollicipes pollicipes]